jgi:hypothetical protein
MSPDRTKITPPELAKRWGVSPDKILAWIRGGELRAFNAARRNGRPRYLIDVADVALFEQARTANAEQSRPATRRRRQQQGVIEFY